MFFLNNKNNNNSNNNNHVFLYVPSKKLIFNYFLVKRFGQQPYLNARPSCVCKLGERNSGVSGGSSARAPPIPQQLLFCAWERKFPSRRRRRRRDDRRLVSIWILIICSPRGAQKDSFWEEFGNPGNARGMQIITPDSLGERPCENRTRVAFSAE